MSTPTHEAGSVLPITGSGPFTLILAAVGLTATLTGAVMRRIARK